LGEEASDFCQAFRDPPALPGLSLQPLAGFEFSRAFGHQLLDDDGPTGDDQEEGPQQTGERQPTSQHCPWLEALPRGQILERRGEA
jgi:hypothetical protein